MDEMEKKTSRKRSPGYPLIDLKEAIQKANTLWQKDKGNRIPKKVAFEHLGYESEGGYSARVLAALKHFGLISEKQNDIMLTKEAIDLALYKHEDQSYKDIVRNIALKPAIYDKLYNEYNGDLPSDATLKSRLIHNYEFNAGKVDKFIVNFRSTIAFAGLLENEEETEDMQKTNPADVTVNAEPFTISTKVTGTATILPSSAAKHYPIPLSKGKTAIISFEVLPIEKKDVDAIKKWLEFFSDNLTETEVY
ncbi:MAG: hypothetical protein HZC49_01660 [Nitrospirae bacterium]|nr:hypothetical protein [Nitrospirota bacterium]